MSNRCLCCGKELPPADTCYHSRCIKKLFHANRIPALNYTQEELNDLAKSIILERVSVPGVQPKLSLHLEKNAVPSASRLTLVGLEGDYILKPQTPQWQHLPEAEHFCMLLARMCKISTADFGLVPLKSGELAYITKRMDRTLQGSLHMEDFCQILNKMTHLKYSGSMEQIGRAIRQYSDTPGLDLIRLLELTIYCFLTGNSDMHLKNFSLLRSADGNYGLAPAYDLVPVKIILPADKEELALTLNGKKSRLKRTDFEAFAHTTGLSGLQTRKTIKRITNAVQSSLSEALNCSFMPNEMQIKISNLVTERLKIFEIHG